MRAVASDFVSAQKSKTDSKSLHAVTTGAFGGVPCASAAGPLCSLN